MSSAWVAELDAALRARPVPSPDGVRRVVEQVVPDTPAGELRYHVTVGPEGMRAFEGAASAPDVTLRMAYQAALGIQRGALSAQEAVAGGQCRVTGDARTLVLVLPALRSWREAIGSAPSS